MKDFIQQAKLFGQENKLDFVEPRVYVHQDGTKTYAALAKLNIPAWGGEVSIDFVADEVRGRYAGRGEVWYAPSHTFDKPFVGALRTPESIATEDGEENLRRRGLAERRYYIMNDICTKRYHQPLSSGTLNENSIPLWEKLVAKGDAIKERNHDLLSPGAFHFKSPI